jgi:hypothetical protein
MQREKTIINHCISPHLSRHHTSRYINRCNSNPRI